MNKLPDRGDPGSNFNRWEVWEAYKRGGLKSRDEMNTKAALETIQVWSDDFERDVMEDVLDAAFGVANE